MMHGFQVRWGWTRRTALAWALCFFLMWVTGVVLYGLPSQELLDMSSTEQGIRRLSVVLHGVLTWFLCVLSGRGVWAHVPRTWHRRSHMRSWWWGVLSLLALLGLVVTGLVLLYGAEWLHATVSTAHFWIGMIALVVLLTHVSRRMGSKPRIKASTAFQSR